MSTGPVVSILTPTHNHQDYIATCIETVLGQSYADWEQKFEHWDWAYDDYAGFPRGENWPAPALNTEPLNES